MHARSDSAPAHVVIEEEWPRFSLAERERRWGRVRQLMAEARLDIVNWIEGFYNGQSLPRLDCKRFIIHLLAAVASARQTLPHQNSGRNGEGKRFLGAPHRGAANIGADIGGLCARA